MSDLESDALTACQLGAALTDLSERELHDFATQVNTYNLFVCHGFPSF